MAFTFKVLMQTIFGDQKVAMGTFTNSSSSGGTINLHAECGWHTCRNMSLQHTGSAAVANSPVVNAVLPGDASNIPIITDPDKNGLWVAIGV